jgi:hypothetical protein
VNISNSFLMDIEVQLLEGGRGARLDLGPYTGRNRGEGYRLSYVGGQRPVFELVRLGVRGSSVIDISESASSLNDGRIHVVRWERFSDGNMVFALDDEVIIRAMDRTFQDSYDGFSIVNYGGEYGFTLIDIHGQKK